MKAYSAIVILLLFAYYSWAQTIEREIVSIAGGYTSTEDIFISFTLGDLAITTFQNTMILDQGFEKGLDHLILGLDEPNTSWISLFPNPTSGIVYVSMNETSNIQLEISIYNLEGKMIDKRQTSSNIPDINITGEKPGLYIIKISDPYNERYGTFKIIKH